MASNFVISGFFLFAIILLYIIIVANHRFQILSKTTNDLLYSKATWDIAATSATPTNIAQVLILLLLIVVLAEIKMRRNKGSVLWGLVVIPLELAISLNAPASTDGFERKFSELLNFKRLAAIGTILIIWANWELPASKTKETGAKRSEKRVGLKSE